MCLVHLHISHFVLRDTGFKTSRTCPQCWQIVLAFVIASPSAVCATPQHTSAMINRIPPKIWPDYNNESTWETQWRFCGRHLSVAHATSVSRLYQDLSLQQGQAHYDLTGPLWFGAVLCKPVIGVWTSHIVSLMFQQSHRGYADMFRLFRMLEHRWTKKEKEKKNVEFIIATLSTLPEANRLIKDPPPSQKLRSDRNAKVSNCPSSCQNYSNRVIVNIYIQPTLPTPINAAGCLHKLLRMQCSSLSISGKGHNILGYLSSAELSEFLNLSSKVTEAALPTHDRYPGPNHCTQLTSQSHTHHNGQG